MTLRVFLATLAASSAFASAETRPTSTELYGEGFPTLDNLTTGEWWTRGKENPAAKKKGSKPPKKNIPMDVPRNEVVAFALYTHQDGVLKLTAQLFPLHPDEPTEVRLEFKSGDVWQKVATEEVQYPGWSAHFRIEAWDNTQDVEYRVLHGEEASFSGLIRKDPIEKDEIIIANLSCNSSRTPGDRPRIIEQLKEKNPDVLFFAGDQTYQHTQLTAGWLAFGMQFREIIRDRPTICICDDHDIGQGNLWGEGGIKAKNPNGDTGGYFYPANYVNMIQRMMCWNLPDADDGTPIARDISVHYTHLIVGGIDIAIIEDRKFKSGPNGKIPKMGRRADHINDPVYDRESVDVEGLKLLGDRQLTFLDEWGQDWTDAEMKVVVSQTAFCGAVHKHGAENNRLLADLDSNAWPQTGRNKAVSAIRRAWASHLCGDQHLAVTVKHGVEEFDDGPYGFTSPALVNTVYGRWWHPEDEKAGPNAVEDSPLPWTGNYLDGLGNKLTMLAYANPEDRSVETLRADGYGLAIYKKSDRSTVFECYDRFKDGTEQFPGWPISFKADENDGREVIGHLPEMTFDNPNPVVQVEHEDTGEILYTVRVQGSTFAPRVYTDGTHTVRWGKDKPDTEESKGVEIAK